MGESKGKSKSNHKRSSSRSSSSPIKPRGDDLRKTKSEKSRSSSSSSSLKKSGGTRSRDEPIMMKKSKSEKNRYTSSSSKSLKKKTTDTDREDLLRKTKSEHSNHRSSSSSSSSLKSRKTKSEHHRSSSSPTKKRSSSSSSSHHRRSSSEVPSTPSRRSKRSTTSTRLDVLATPARCTSSKKKMGDTRLYNPDLSTCPASPRKVEQLRNKCRNIEGWHDGHKKQSSDTSMMMMMMMNQQDNFYDEEGYAVGPSTVEMRTSKSTTERSSDSCISTTNNNPSSSSSEKKEQSWYEQHLDDHNNKRNIIFAAVVIVALFGIVVLALVGLSRDGSGDGADARTTGTPSSTNLRGQQTIPTGTEIERPRQPPSGPGYPCYKSTLDMYTDQIDFDSDPNVPMDIDKPLVICPNTTINVGILNFGRIFDVEYRDGDFPITPFRKNVVVQCGKDGKRSNNCVVQGGLTQVRAQSRQWHPTKGDVQPSDSIDGFTVKGITFTGAISSIPYAGTSIEISHPGRGIKFEDCAWTGIGATNSGLINVGKTTLMESLGTDNINAVSVELTIANSLFEGITYNQLFIQSVQQILIVENTVFRDVVLSTPDATGCETTDGGCRSLIYSPPGGPSKVSVSSICVENFDVQDAGPVVVSAETDWSPSGINIWVGPSEFVDDDGLSPSNNNGGEEEFCDMGVAQLGFGNSHRCLEFPLFEQGAEGSCDFF